MIRDELCEAARAVRDEWNRIHTLVVSHAQASTVEMFAGDIVYLKLAKVAWPWTEGPAKAGFVQFDMHFPEDRKVMTATLVTMAYLLRQYDRKASIAVFDPHRYGFGLKHQGADDITIQDLFPVSVAN